MPGPALHHMIADRLRSRILRGSGLGRLPSSDYVRLRTLLNNPANLPYLFFGCQGPDFLFFSTRDLDPRIGRFVNLYLEVHDFIEELRRKILDLVPDPILQAVDALEEAIGQVADTSVLVSELQQTFSDVGAAGEALAALVTEKLKQFVSEFNLFDLIEHPYRDGVEPGSWWWFDAAHYRKTGRFTAALLEAARDTSSPLHLYAIGYLTHFAADTVGHPYVSLNSGGPYRSHAQRHKAGENFQDVFNLLETDGIDWNDSKLHALYNFNFTGAIDTENEIPDPFTRLPDDLAALIANALNDVFRDSPGPNGQYGNIVTAQDIQDSYRVWHRWFTDATETGTLPPPPTYSFSEELREVWDKAMENLGDVGEYMQNAVDEMGEGGILGIFLALAQVILGAVLAVIAVVDAILGAITTLGTATIRAGACLVYELLFDVYQNFRLTVALNGLAFPMREHLQEPRFNQFIKLDNPDSTGVNAGQIAGRMPLLRNKIPFLDDPMAAIFSQERHLTYPPTAGERPSVSAAPASYLTAKPTHYAFGDIPLTSGLLSQLALLPNATGAHETLLAQLMAQGELGNALDLSASLYDRWRRGESIPDFNLDADRGYGYLCWTQVEGGAPDPANAPDALRTNTSDDPNFAMQIRFIP